MASFESLLHCNRAYGVPRGFKGRPKPGHQSLGALRATPATLSRPHGVHCVATASWPVRWVGGWVSWWVVMWVCGLMGEGGLSNVSRWRKGGC